MLRYILPCLLVVPSLRAQSPEPKIVKTITQTTTNHHKSTYILGLKVSTFDTAQILIAQQRFSYSGPDTAASKTSEYNYQYNPNGRLGQFSTTRIPTATNRLEKPVVNLTKFKSHNHRDDYDWVHQFDENGKVFLETEHSYDAQGLRISSRSHDVRSQVVNFDQLERNSAGRITKWSSTDTEFGKETLVRLMTYSYLHDTLLLTQEGYIYSNWTQTTNKYDKNNRLASAITETGYRQPSGKVLRDAKTQTKYKDGLPVSSTYSENGKKISSSTFVHSPNSSTETITTKQKKTTTITTKTSRQRFDDKNRLVENTQLENDQIAFSKLYTYQDSTLVQFTEIERKNTELWKTVTDYNSEGLPIRRQLLNGDALQQEDIFEYTYHTK